MVACVVVFSGCDVQSGITKKSVEKYVPTPTPAPSATVAEQPVDPADVVTADTAEPGEMLQVNTADDAKKGAKCDKFNRVMINGHNKEVNVTGVCSRLSVNGNNNKIKMAAAAEVVINGNENVVEYSKYANGKRPIVTDNGTGNDVSFERIP